MNTFTPLPPPFFGSAALSALEHSLSQFRYELLIESAGLFWLSAESLILFLILVASRFFAEAIPGESLTLQAREKTRAILWSFALFVVALWIYGRHFIIPPLYKTLGSPALETRESIVRAYETTAHIHLATWCAFITLWILLEVAIVYCGTRAYLTLKSRLRHG